MDASVRTAADSRPRAPSGTVTFLFSDIEGSTLRWERFPEAMGDAVRRHDALVRAAVSRSGGFVFKTIGDAFCVAFARPEDAAAAAIETQRALASADFSAVDGVRVRIGLHTGAADERDGDYFGPTVNRVARITSVGSGGQILLSAITAEIARANLPPDATLVELGDFRLKDLATPERIFQLNAPDLAYAFPALRTPDLVQNNLPATISSFVGRERELATLRAMLADHRLLTIVGPGGIGKTRTSLQLAESLAGRFDAGIWFVDLATITTPELVVDQFAAALGIRADGAQPLVERIAAALGRGSALAIVDNCEHLIEPVAATVQRLLTMCPELRILATSRESLRIPGERQFTLAALTLPERYAPLTALEALGYSAVVLLVDRATAASPSFALTDENALDVVEVCRRLDALPFALELAAPRMVTFTPKELLARVGERFRMLRGTRAVGPERTRTLLSLIDWSHDLLPERERVLFRRLSIFASAWSLEDAFAVAGDDDLDEYDLIDMLGSLVSKSMIVADADAENGRFRFLESMHQYAAERLAESSERAEIERRFAALVLAHVRRVASALEGMSERDWLDEIEGRIDDIRVVLHATLAGGADVALGAEIAATLGFFWHARRPTEGATWLAQARGVAESVAPALRAHVYLESARVDVTSPHTVPFAERAVAMYREIDDPAGLARALEYLGQSLINVGRFREARAYLGESIARTPHDGNRAASARTRGLHGLATLYDDGDLEAAERDLEGARIDLETKHRYRDAAVALRGLGQIEVERGRYARAAERVERALFLCEDLEDPRGTGLLRFELAHAFLLDDRLVDARANALESLHLLRDSGIPMGLNHTLLVLGAILERLGDREAAALVTGYVDEASGGAAQRILPQIARLRDDVAVRLRVRLGDAAYADAFARGRRLDAREIEALVRRDAAFERPSADHS